MQSLHQNNLHFKEGEMNNYENVHEDILVLIVLVGTSKLDIAIISAIR